MLVIIKKGTPIKQIIDKINRLLSSKKHGFNAVKYSGILKLDVDLIKYQRDLRNDWRIFVDTNILIYLLQGNQEISKILDGKNLTISFITELELLGIPHVSSQEKGHIEELIEDCNVININPEIKIKAVEIRQAYKLN